MFKLVVLSVFIAVAAAHPGGYESSRVVYSAPIVREQMLAKVGTVVKSVPTVVSHQSSTVVHKSGHIVRPIVTPILKTYVAAPIHHTPLVRSYAAAPLRIASPAHFTYAAAAPIAYHSAPLSYASGW